MAEVLIAGPELRWQFAAAERKAHFRALVLILPLLLFVLVTFAAPVVLLLMRAVYDPSIAGTLPETVSSLRDWDGKTALPLVFILHGDTRDEDFYSDRSNHLIPKAAEKYKLPGK